MYYDSALIEHFSFYEKNVLPVILTEPLVRQKLFGYHGILTHTRSVVFRGIDYCLSLTQDVLPVMLACAFHDLAKDFDGYDVSHGIKAIPIAKNVVARLNLGLSHEKTEMIFDAIKNHTTGMGAKNYISGCLWDADRTRLSWQCGYDEMYYYSSRAKQIASGDPHLYVNYMCECLKFDYNDELLSL